MKRFILCLVLTVAASLFAVDASAAPKELYSEDILSESEDCELLRAMEAEIYSTLKKEYGNRFYNTGDFKVFYDEGVRVYDKYLAFEGKYVSEERLTEIAGYCIKEKGYFWQIPAEFAGEMFSVLAVPQKPTEVHPYEFILLPREIKSAGYYISLIEKDLPQDAKIRLFNYQIVSTGYKGCVSNGSAPLGIVVSEERITGLFALGYDMYQIEELKRVGNLVDYEPIYDQIEELRTDPFYHWQYLNADIIAPYENDPEVSYLPGILLAVLLVGGIVLIVVLKNRVTRKMEEE